MVNETEQPKYTVSPLTPEEMAAMTAEITAILDKYNAEIGVSSQLQFLKRTPVTNNENNTTTEEAKPETTGADVAEVVEERGS